MILRKPYAILIKYFKVIHIIMFILFVYLVFALRKIYDFFANYIATSNFTYIEGMSSIYVPWLLYLIVIILLGLSIGILLLMNKKQKPVLFYKIMIGFCVFLFIMLVYFSGFFKSLDNTVYEPLSVVINRDIILFAYIANFFFVAFSFIRGFGFDIKKFSFDKDKKELNLEESDNEEYELNVNLEKEDVKSFVKRHRRELRYYLRENKAILLTVAIILLVSLSLYTYYDLFVVNKVYNEGDNVSVGTLNYRVNSSAISNISKYGQIISTDDDYLIVDINIINNVSAGYLDDQNFRVHIGDDYYYPSSQLCDLFSDMGTCYKNQELKVDSESDYILAYKIKKDYKVIYLEILKNKGDEYQYSKVKLSYNKIEPKNQTTNINEEFELNDNKYAISNYSIQNKNFYQYEECKNDNCSTYTKVVLPKTGKKVLTLEINNLEKLSDDFLKSGVGIEYNGKKYSGKDIEFIDRYSNYVYYSIPDFSSTVNTFNLLITTRTTIYSIPLGVMHE